MGTEGYALAAMAHELRTPLTAILGYSELLQEEVRSDEGRHYATALLEAAHILGSTVEAMLDYTRIHRGELKLAETKVDLAGIAACAVRLVQPSAERRDMCVRTCIEDDVASFRGDERLFRQLLSNLLVNAVRYGDEGSRIFLRAACHAGSLEIRIEDCGLGIAPEDIERAFLPFDRLGRSCDGHIHASGIGLPLCRAIAELHGGTVTLDSRVGVGTTAIVRIPAWRMIVRAPQLQESFDFAMA